MGNCKDCRHWRSVHDTLNRTYHECDAVGFEIEASKPGPDGVEGNGFVIYTNDTHGSEESFRTGPNFGCVRFQPAVR